MLSEYDLNVFINCPFDREYTPLFNAILFSVYKCGFRPRCAREMDDAGEIRIDKINKIISECRFGIHDISRTELDSTHNLPRFNMPLELGIFLGAKKFGSKIQRSKVSIILDKEQYRYQKYISDISGQDIKSHGNVPEDLIRTIRNSLNSANHNGHIAGAHSIISSYTQYQAKLPELMQELSLQEDDVTYADETQMIEQWLKLNP